MPWARHHNYLEFLITFKISGGAYSLSAEFEKAMASAFRQMASSHRTSVSNGSHTAAIRPVELLESVPLWLRHIASRPCVDTRGWLHPESKDDCAHVAVKQCSWGYVNSIFAKVSDAHGHPDWNCCGCGRAQWWPQLVQQAWIEAEAAQEAAFKLPRACAPGIHGQPALRMLRIAATTFNRPELTEVSALSLRHSLDIAAKHTDVKISLIVYDDSSLAFSSHQLKLWYGQNATIRQNIRRRGASHQMVALFRDFLVSDADAVLVADSDVLFPSRWVELVERAWPCSTGWMNIMTHRGELPPCGRQRGAAVCEAPAYFCSGPKAACGGGDKGSMLSKGLARLALIKVCGTGLDANLADVCNTHGLMDLLVGKTLSTLTSISVIRPLGIAVHFGLSSGLHTGPDQHGVGADKKYTML